MNSSVQAPKPSCSLTDLLTVLVEHKGSDLHLQAGEVPIGRFNGELGRFEMPPVSEEDVLRLAREVLGSDEKMREFQATRDCDAAVAIPELGRFRVNLFYQRNLPGMVLRTIGTRIATIEQLEPPEVLKTIAGANDGLVLVTGATGSGKSTTLAALIDHVNSAQACHIMTRRLYPAEPSKNAAPAR
jgi:twitching motility protein PilT